MRSYDEVLADAADQAPFSNHTEYGIWAARYCYDCVRDDDATETWCPILSAAMTGVWPTEWSRRAVTGPVGSSSYEVVDTCSEFERRRDDDGGGEPDGPPPGPVAECDGQLDLVDAYLDTAINELTREATRAAA